VWECGEEQTDRQTNTQTAVANIHFALAMPHAKCNEGLMYQFPSPIKDKFGMKDWTHGVFYHAEFHIDWFIVSPPPNFDLIFNFTILWWSHLTAQRQC